MMSIMRRFTPLSRYIHVSTGPGYVPRSAVKGFVRGDESQIGRTYAPGNNRMKRQRRILRKMGML